MVATSIAYFFPWARLALLSDACQLILHIHGIRGRFVAHGSFEGDGDWHAMCRHRRCRRRRRRRRRRRIVIVRRRRRRRRAVFVGHGLLV